MGVSTYTVLNWLVVIFYLGVFSFLFLFIIYIPFSSFTLISITFYCDLLSSTLILLTIWIISMIYLCSYKVELNFQNKDFFLFLVYFLIFVLLLTFLVNNYLLFYIIFEISLIPTLVLIIGWGYQPERLQAGVYLIIYTICASLPLLRGILFYSYIKGRLFMFFSADFFSFGEGFFGLWWLIFIMAFMVKMPIYLFHLWLPKAHVEAPVAGSIILAGVLLKLGGYGLLRVRSLIMWGNLYVCGLFLSVSIWGAFITSMICLRQVDIKSLIAYSSVGHIGLLIRGFIGSQVWGWVGRLRIIIAHGLVSSGLFSLANISYENTSTRSIYLTKGLLSVIPSLSLFWFIFRVINIGAPPSLNLFSEIILLTRILSNSFYLSILIGFSSFLAGAYSLYLYTSLQHGQLRIYINSFNSLNFRIFNSLIFHIVPCLIFILSPEYISLWF